MWRNAYLSPGHLQSSRWYSPVGTYEKCPTRYFLKLQNTGFHFRDYPLKFRGRVCHETCVMGYSLSAASDENFTEMMAFSFQSFSWYWVIFPSKSSHGWPGSRICSKANYKWWCYGVRVILLDDFMFTMTHIMTTPPVACNQSCSFEKLIMVLLKIVCSPPLEPSMKRRLWSKMVSNHESNSTEPKTIYMSNIL